VLQLVDADLDFPHEIIIAIKQLNLNVLEKIVHEVSDPFSVKYGNYLTREEIGKLTYNAVALDVVKKYLDINDIINYNQTLYGEYIQAYATRRKWEKMFNAKFMAYKHKSSGRIVFRSSSYTLDSSLVDHVFAVCNVADLPYFKVNNREHLKPNEVSLQSLSSHPSGFITPSALQSYYNISSNEGNSLTSQTIYSSDGEYFSSTDLAAFQHTFGIPSHPVDDDLNNRDIQDLCNSYASRGDYLYYYDCFESNLDLQYILSVAQNVPTSIM